jgi:ankyrin repeat protein
VTVLIENGADPNSGDLVIFHIHRTPLQWALTFGKENVVEALIRLGVDVNFGNPPPVTIAAAMGRLKSLNLLIEKGVDLSAEVSVEIYRMFDFLGKCFAFWF